MSKDVVKVCGRCDMEKHVSFFARRSKSADRCQSWCKECQQEYYREYIIPSLRGCGKARALPMWLKGLVKPPVELPHKVIKLADYRNEFNRKMKRLVVVG